MRTLVWWISLSLVSMALLPKPLRAEDGTKRQRPVTVMTYNIRYLNDRDGEDVWSHRREAVSQTIRLVEIVGLQEVVAEQLDQIREDTPEFDWYGVGRDDGRRAGEACPIGWRRERFDADERGTFWLSPTPDQVGSLGWDAALPRIASWVRLRDRQSGLQLLAVNTHFDHRGAEAREQSARLIREWVTKHQADTPVVVTGDLNATLNSPPLRQLLSNAPDGTRLLNARDVCSVPDPGPNSTWNGFREIQPGRRIDFVIVSEGLKVSSVETLNPKTAAGRFASDHLPVRAVVVPSH